MTPTSTPTPRVVPTDATAIIAVDVDVSELYGDGYPASTAAEAAMRSYKQTGSDGLFLDIVHRTWSLFVSQLNTF